MSGAEVLAAWQAVVDAATRGEWVASHDSDGRFTWRQLIAVGSSPDDAAFIALSCYALPRAIEALRAVLDLAERHTDTDHGDREWGDVPGWRLRDAITAALDVTP